VNPDKISVIIPLYNKAPHIERAIKSVFSQTSPFHEILVIDDGSTDGGGEIVKALNEPRISLHRQKNMGVSAARNLGIVLSQGELIAFLDADDEWRPQFLEITLRLRSKYPNCGLFASAYEVVPPYYKKADKRYKAIPPAPWEGIIPDYFKTAALGIPPICSSSAVVPRYVFDCIGKFQIGESLGEDVDMWGRIALKYPVAFSWQLGAIYHHDSSGRACETRMLSWEHPFLRTLRTAGKDLKSLEETKPFLKEYMAALKLGVARQSFLAGNSAFSKEILSSCETRMFRFAKLKLKLLMIMPPPLLKAAMKISEAKRKRLARISEGSHADDQKGDLFS